MFKRLSYPTDRFLDGVYIVNELIDLAKRRKNKCLLFKVDFERVYDTVNWNFLDYMMSRMGFADGWCRWIRACVFQSSMSVLVNGSTTKDFNVGKGLRQGDPLSPFLFLIVAEGLTGLMRSAVANSLFHGYKVSNNTSFHALQFADDTIIVGEGNWDNLWTIETILRSFELVSGLKVNFHKSKLYGINIEDHFLRASSSFLHYEVESIPFRSLGTVGLKHASIWWHDIWSLGGTGDGNWFGTDVSSIISDGNNIGFWKEKWLGMEPLHDLYPVLFIKIAHQNYSVSNMGKWDNNSWSWKLEWTSLLTEMESADAADLQLLLEQVQPCRDRNDRRKWIPNTTGLFPVQSAYIVLQKHSVLTKIEPNILSAWKRLWINNVPSKVLILGGDYY
ncbi:hypothetical protein TSUD_12890 [Trifolium subterraneum]|uniref:Reverse transcriptase domain-containing protein n=1 Tax=Trifolium subterraneum TaxID=3900 RepID=A0A2Z6NEN4_TRISU|nr:hypothetical protein TSUD_12890 [Trifolium subterraneum]